MYVYHIRIAVLNLTSLPHFPTSCLQWLLSFPSCLPRVCFHCWCAGLHGRGGWWYQSRPRLQCGMGQGIHTTGRCSQGIPSMCNVQTHGSYVYVGNPASLRNWLSIFIAKLWIIVEYSMNIIKNGCCPEVSVVWSSRSFWIMYCLMFCPFAWRQKKG